MKKLFFLLAVLMLSFSAFSQDKDSVKSRDLNTDSGNSLLKLNVLALPIFSFTLS